MQARLIDIHDLDPVGWWPPAPGWWLSAVALFLLLVLLALLVRRLIHYPPGSWQKEADQALRQLRRSHQQMPVKDIASRLSELLRRIAMARFGRQRQASLSGEEWLRWLQHSDPNHYDWPDRGRWLLRLPYAPDDQSIDRVQLKELIDAAQRLVAVSRKTDAQWRLPAWWRGRNV